MKIDGPLLSSPALPELRRTYPMSFGSLSIPVSEDTALHTGESMSYYADDRDWNHDFTYYRDRPGQQEKDYKNFYHMNLSKFDFEHTVALSADGRTAIGQQTKNGRTSLVDLPLKRSFPRRMFGFLERWGWLPMPKIVDLPEKATAFSLSPKGALAVAIGQNVYLHEGNRLRPWQAYQEKVRDAEYLSDGTLAVITEKESRAGLSRFQFHLTAPGESVPTVLPFKEVHPEAYREDVETKCKDLAFLKDSTFSQKERFLEQGAWLTSPQGWLKRHQTLSHECVVVTDTHPQVWRYDPASSQASAGPVLELPAHELDFKGPLHALEGGFIALSGPAVPVGESAGSTFGKNLSGTIPVWDPAGKLAIELPGVSDFRVTSAGHVSFRDPEGGTHTVAPGSLGELKREGWYLRSLKARLLGSEPSELAKTGIEVLQGQLRVGSTLLKIRR